MSIIEAVFTLGVVLFVVIGITCATINFVGYNEENE